MCLAIPMCIVSIDDFSALCEARGQQRRVSLLPLFGESLAPGDWVQVHLDRAVQRMTAEDAAAAWEVYQVCAERSVPLAERNLRLAREAYDAGGASFLTVLEANRFFLQARTRAIESHLRAAQTLPALERAIGAPISQGAIP